ncbi:unnamed protein product [Brassica rapa subsp. trilocularis]
MPPEFDEIDEKEGSNDDSDGEDHRRFNLESPRLFTEASYCSDASRRVSLNEGQGSPERLSPLPRFLSVGRTFRLSLRGRVIAWNVKKSGELMGVDLILVDGKVNALKGGDNNPGHDIPGAGTVTTDPSQSVERGIHDNSNRPSNHVMVESLSGTVTEPSDIPVSSDMSSAESVEAVCAHSAKKPHHG